MSESTPTEKRCTYCGHVKPLDAFNKQRDKPLGVRAHCKACRALHRSLRAQGRSIPPSWKQWATDPDNIVRWCPQCDRLLPRTADHFHRDQSRPGGLFPWCRDCAREEKREAWKVVRDDVNAQRRREYAENPEPVLAYNAHWRSANRERYLASKRRGSRRYYRRHRDRLLARGREWAKRNRDKRRTNLRQYRARKAGAAGAHTLEDILAKYELQGGRCYYCDAELGDTYDVDHKIPLTRGGSNHPANMCCACIACNRSKSNKPFWSFIRERREALPVSA